MSFYRIFYVFVIIWSALTLQAQAQDTSPQASDDTTKKKHEVVAELYEAKRHGKKPCGVLEKGKKPKPYCDYTGGEEDAASRSSSFAGGIGGSGQTHFIETIDTDYIERKNVEERLGSLGVDLMGDQIDLYTGALSFQHTDISIPGNFGIDVAIRRSRSTDFPFRTDGTFTTNRAFGDWKLEVPRLSIIAPTTPDPKFCEGTFVPFMIIDESDSPNGPDATSGVFLEPQNVSGGANLIVPGAGSQALFGKRSGEGWPASTNLVTTRFWRIECGSVVGGMKSTIAIDPSGTRYTFSKFAQRNVKGLPVTGSTSPSGYDWSTIVERSDHLQLVTNITDIHGNSVTYSYNSGGWLTGILASDGRQITVAYNGSGLISSVSANGRTWVYRYTTVPSGYQVLDEVERPDGRFWSFDLSPTVVEANSKKHIATPTACRAQDQQWSMTHPHGTVGTFTFTEIERPITTLSPPKVASCIAGTPLQTVTTTDTMAVKQKRLSGSGLTTADWNFAYSHSSAGVITEVTDPLGDMTRATHDTSTKQVTKQERYDGGVEVRETRFTYQTESSIGTNWLEGTVSGHEALGILSSPRNKTQTVVDQSSDSYTSTATFNSVRGSAGYSYGFPVETRTFSNIHTGPRGQDTDYIHNTTQWILGLPQRVYEVGTTGSRREVSSSVYNSNGLLTSLTRYGQPWASLTYHTTGTALGKLRTVSDALSPPRVTQALDWKRGVPQRIIRADGQSEYQYVDNNGWLTSKQDAMANVTAYSHDTMGRLTLIDPPGSWANTAIAYTFPASGAVQTVTKGQARTTVTYDSLFRPILERTQALDTGWSSYVNTDYDRLGQVSFKSQPSFSAVESKGVDFIYDALGRIYEETETVAPYAKTMHRYYSAHISRIYDPTGAYTQYHTFGYSGPDSKDYRAIHRYANGAYQQHTNLYQDQYGLLYRLRQRGLRGGFNVDHNQNFYYDSNQRLCRHYVPEHGATLYQYDAAGQRVASAKGQSNSGCGAVPAVSARVTQAYDVLGRPTLTNFSDAGTPDITRTYDLNSNLKTVFRNGVNWTYAYNDINALTSEKLDIDGRNYDIDYGYNTAGQLTSKNMPSGRALTYLPDGLGRTRVTYNNGAWMVDQVNWHANGSVSSMRHRNTQLFTQTLDARQLPLRLHAAMGGTTAMDQTFGYDIRGQVTSIIDAAVSGNNRTYGYDTMGSLVSASGPWGSGSYSYDSMGNLRSKQLGARTVTLNYDVTRNRVSQSIDTGSSGTRTVAYDGRGNVTTLGTLAFVYDMSDQPVTVSGTANGIGAANGNYTYDGNLKRVKSVVNGKTIYNVYDAGGALVHIDAVTDAKTTDYVTGPMGTLARITNNVVTYLHPDPLGSAQSGTTATGAVAWREQYTPFGEELQSPAANDNLGGFTGHIKDKTTGLNYMQARYYDPVMGRFLSVDPVGFMDTGNPSMFNRYAYTSNDPVNRIDPFGLDSCETVRPDGGSAGGIPNCIGDPDGPPTPVDEADEVIDEIVTTAQIIRQKGNKPKLPGSLIRKGLRSEDGEVGFQKINGELRAAWLEPKCTRGQTSAFGFPDGFLQPGRSLTGHTHGRGFAPGAGPHDAQAVRGGGLAVIADRSSVTGIYKASTGSAFAISTSGSWGAAGARGVQSMVNDLVQDSGQGGGQGATSNPCN